MSAAVYFIVLGVTIRGNPFLGLVLLEYCIGVFALVLNFDFTWCWSEDDPMREEDD